MVNYMVTHPTFGIVVDTEDNSYPEFDSSRSCIGLDTNFFYVSSRPESPGDDKEEEWLSEENLAEGFYGAQYHFLSRICESCPFMRECFSYAVHHEDHGYWGGTSPNDRRELRKEHGIKYDDLYKAFDVFCLVSDDRKRANG